MFLTDEEYQHVIDLMDGTAIANPIFLELAAWTMQRFGIRVYDYVCDRTVNNLTRLRVVIWDHVAEKTFREGGNYNKAIQLQFQEQFAALARKYQMHPEYQDASQIFVCWETVRDQLAGKILWRSRMEFDNFRFNKPDVWKVSVIFDAVHIFYETDAQIKQHEADGVSDTIRREVAAIVAGDDPFGAFAQGVSCVFTSQQTLNEKYKGSMFYYTR